jgi:hypothetical protein
LINPSSAPESARDRKNKKDGETQAIGRSKGGLSTKIHLMVSEREGLLTGYYEPIVQGSRFPSPEFHIPVYRRPHDLVVAGIHAYSFVNSNAALLCQIGIEMAMTSTAITSHLAAGIHAVFCTFSPSSSIVRSRMMNF